jgi:cellulose synthase/poly-beta-1,6-N-acetylglucosamine synthase-like glycosyltransferase
MQLISNLRSALPQIVAVLPFVCYGFVALVFLAGIVRLSLVARSTILLKRHLRSMRAVDYRRFQDSEHLMPVSLILPATNETGRLNEQINSLLSLEFKQYELIVVANSAHTDAWASLREGYKLLPFRQPFKKTLNSSHVEAVYRSAKDVRLVVLDIKDANNAGALNAGVNVSTYPIIVPVYPGLRLTRDALLKTVYAFVSDPACVFIGSVARIDVTAEGEAGKRMSILAQQQYIERIRSLYSNRIAYEKIGLYLSLRGQFAAFLKSAVVEAGGFSGEAKADAADLLLRIHARMRKDKRTYCAKLLPDTVCVELPQKSIRTVCAAQRRGQHEMRASVRRNSTIARALRGAGYTRFTEKTWPLLELLCIVTVLASAALGAVPILFLVLYLLLGVLFGSIQSVFSVLLEEYAFQRQTDTGLLLGRYVLAIFDNIGFHLRVTLARIFS